MWQNDFSQKVKTQPTHNGFYDIEYDALLIEQSVAKQYGVLPSAQKEMHYADWAVLVSGLMHDTPLGQVVLIRRETDYKTIQKFTPEQRKIHSDWQKFVCRNTSEEQHRQQAAQLEKLLGNMFGRKGG